MGKSSASASSLPVQESLHPRPGMSSLYGAVCVIILPASLAVFPHLPCSTLPPLTSTPRLCRCLLAAHLPSAVHPALVFNSLPPPPFPFPLTLNICLFLKKKGSQRKISVCVGVVVAPHCACVELCTHNESDLTLRNELQF